MPVITNLIRAVDVAAFIINRQGEMPSIKLQSLVYYSQAWSLAWDETPLFSERVEAWATGPIIPELYAKHGHLFKVGSSHITASPCALQDFQVETVEAVLRHYGGRHTQWLSKLTRAEPPWKDTRRAILHAPVYHRGVIPLSAMAEYYVSL